MSEQEYILEEKSYVQTMEKEVIPYLDKRRSVLWLQRENGFRQYCIKYIADAPKGTIVISHGFTETAEKYQEVIWYFLTHHYNVFIPEHCGHGYSYRLVKDLSLVHVDSYQRYVRDLIDVARRAQREWKELPLYLYAHSMGGGVGAAVISQEPKLFARAILTSPMIRPLTSGVPWPVAKPLAALLCKLGRADKYVPGGHAFDGKETFENSASMCRERFDFYQRRRNTEPLYQMNSASCGWLNEAAKLNRYLMTEGFRRIETPLLIFQAENETFVCNAEQARFQEKINQNGKTTAKLLPMPETKHEIFMSSSRVLKRYWEAIFAFLDNK